MIDERLWSLVAMVATLGAAGCPGGSGARGQGWTSGGGASSAEEGPDLERLVLPEGRQHWPDDGFVEMVPPVRLPTTHDHRDLVRVWLRIPEGGRIEARWLDDQDRPTLRSPPGTEMDRVEYIRYPIDGGWAPTVIDVRGWDLGHRGPRRFRLARATSGEPMASVAGWSWPAHDDGAHDEARERMVRMVATVSRPVREPPLEGDSLRRFERMTDCLAR